MKCQFCNKECKNENSLRNHERLCGANPNKKPPKPKSQKWLDAMHSRKGKATNQWTSESQYVLKDSTRDKLREKSKKQVWTEEQKIKHSQSMKKAVELHPEAYTSSNRGRVKQIIYLVCRKAPSFRAGDG